MPVKHYLLSGRVIEIDGTTLTVNFADPRPWETVSVTQCHVTLTNSDESQHEQQYCLRSNALTNVSTSGHRELRAGDNEEITSTALGHLKLIAVNGNFAHYELTMPVTMSFGNTANKMSSIDFYITDNADVPVQVPTNVTEAITRYDFSGSVQFDADGTDVATTMSWSWGPSPTTMGGALYFPTANNSTWSYNYSTEVFKIKWENQNAQAINCDWDDTAGVMTFNNESWVGVHFANATVNLVPDSVLYNWTQDANAYTGTILGGTNSTWSYDMSTLVVTVLWGGNAAQWYTMEVDPSDSSRLIALGDYGDIHTVGTVMWQLPSGSSYVTDESGFGFTVGAPVISFNFSVPAEDEVITEYPLISLRLTCSAHN